MEHGPIEPELVRWLPSHRASPHLTTPLGKLAFGIAAFIVAAAAVGGARYYGLATARRAWAR